MVASLMKREWRALETMAEFGMQPNTVEGGRLFGCLVVQPTLINQILEVEYKDEELLEWFETMVTEDPKEWSVGPNGGFRFKN